MPNTCQVLILNFVEKAKYFFADKKSVYKYLEKIFKICYNIGVII